MKRWFRGFRKASDLRERQERQKIVNEQVSKLRTLVQAGGHAAEPEFIQFLKDYKPTISKEEIAERVRLFHVWVNEWQSHGQVFR